MAFLSFRLFAERKLAEPAAGFQSNYAQLRVSILILIDRKPFWRALPNFIGDSHFQKQVVLRFFRWSQAGGGKTARPV